MTPTLFLIISIISLIDRKLSGRQIPLVVREFGSMPCERDQRGFGAAMVFLEGEQRMGRRKELQRALSAGFLVTATKLMKLFPGRRLDDRQRDLAAFNRRLDRADGSAVFETARRALFRHRLGALDAGMLKGVRGNPFTDSEPVTGMSIASTR
jgi:hypothetical protein